MAGDKHWRAEPQKFAAEQIAARLARYPWVKQAKAKKPLFKEQKQPFEQSMGYYDYLPEAILAKAITHRNGFFFNNVSAGDTPLEVTSPASPVLVTGDSFVNHGYPFSGGLVGHLARSINQPVTVNQVAGNIVQTFQDMFRDPSLLDGKKVVIWIMNGEPFGSNWMFPEKFKTP